MQVAPDSPAALKRKTARAALLRWHSDKFHGRFGERVALGGERGRIDAKLGEITRFLKGLMSEDAVR